MKNPNLKHNQGENNPMFGKHHSPTTVLKIKQILSKKLSGKGNPRYGTKLSAETKAKISNSLKGKISPNLNKKHSKERIEKNRLSHLGQASWNKGKKFTKISGANHWNWKGGINPTNDSIRKSLEMKLSREATFKRDNFICQECGKKGGKLSAHHIKPFYLFPELRFALDNLVTLCEKCHFKTDTYAGKVIKYKKTN